MIPESVTQTFKTSLRLFNFNKKLREARSRLYGGQLLQVNTITHFATLYFPRSVYFAHVYTALPSEIPCYSLFLHIILLESCEKRDYERGLT